MFSKMLLAAVAVASLTVELSAADVPMFGSVSPVSWRGGYRYRRYSSSASTTRASSGARTYSSNRASSGRSSPLDYPAYSQPRSSRQHQWNKYPNQPYYLRGERKSLLILP
ncbi:MAG TPA: hypothetical protein VFI31_22305 [Pirellulales bacterium]|nr:hypothetical protein [Pirellulales bacterium]